MIWREGTVSKDCCGDKMRKDDPLMWGLEMNELDNIPCRRKGWLQNIRDGALKMMQGSSFRLGNNVK